MGPTKSSRFFDPDRLLLFIFIAFKLILSLLPIHYGIFRDEFYYLSMSNRLGLGYVDVPPLAPFLLAINRFLFGDSIFALHLLPALSGALFLWLAYRLAKTLGGNRYALFLTLVAVLLAPYYVAIDAIYTYDTFSKLFWLLFSYLIIRLIQTENPRYWIYLGIATGLGLLFKITLLNLAFGWVISLLLTKKRRLLWRWEVVGAGALALLIFSPYLVWQFQHDFVSLEYYRNYTGKINSFSPIEYLLEQIMSLNPATFIIWLAGLYFLFFHPQGKTFRSAGITYLIILFLSYTMHAKPDLILPFYTLLLAVGSVWLGNLLVKKQLEWLRIGITGLVITTGILTLPVARPVLPVETFIRIYSGIGAGNVERQVLGRLPQFYADRFGWEELTAKVAAVYHLLPMEERSKAGILVGNYGEAGAIEFYGKKYGLPLPPLSGHNQYHVWGPGRFTGEVMIITGIPYDQLAGKFGEIKTAAVFSNPYVMPYENNLPIYVCRRPSQPLPEVKPWIKWLN
jgi:4-amino-4-deoxy-L-arabinose transferase-like glycosyltransferase